VGSGCNIIGANNGAMASLLQTDISCDMIFGQSLNLVESGYYSDKFLGNLDMFVENVWISKEITTVPFPARCSCLLSAVVHAPWIAQFALLLPNILTNKIVPGYAYFREVRIFARFYYLIGYNFGRRDTDPLV
jgi:hypothetical protein